MKVIRHLSALLALVALASQSSHGEEAEKPEPVTATEFRITNVAEGIIRVQVAPKGTAFRQSPVTAVLPDLPAFSGSQTITVAGKDGVIAVSGLDGKPLLTQTAVTFAPSTVNKQTYPSVRVAWRSERPDALYGMGSYQGGGLNLRGQTRRMVQENKEDTVPMFFSTAGFGILWDNPSVGTFRADQEGGFSIHAACSDLVDYYIIAGKTPDEVIAGYRMLTGPAPMLPKWAFGYHQSRERYRTQEQVLEVARTFREIKFPIDLIIQDWRYWGAHGWNACTFDKENYPDANAMLKELADMNIQCIASVWPSFGDGNKGSAVYQELDKNGMLSVTKAIWGSRLYNAYDPKAREIVWKHVKEGLWEPGIDGWWLDAAEPEVGTVEWGEINLPGPFDSIRNAYPLYVVKAFYEGQRKDAPDRRFFTLTRSAYAGSQRAGISYWTGDTRGDWDTLAVQIQACLGMSAAGIPYVNTDIGGFTASGKSDSPNYRELYLRWFQFGTFCPEMRSHGTRTPREPWYYGNPGETVYDTLLKFADLRYQLLPYIYSTSWKVTSEGYTMMRPLAMDFPCDTSIHNTKDKFMFGPSLLVAPVLRPIGEGLDAIPASSLADRNKQEGGLDATYFKDRDLKEAVLTRKDPGVAFAWDNKKRAGVGENIFTDPIPELGGMTDFSACWEGYIKTSEAGAYTLGVNADDAFRLYVNGELKMEVWRKMERKMSAASEVCKIELPADALVPVKLEYFQSRGPAFVQLNWMKPGKTTVQDVPLPGGANWYDFWTGAFHKGGQTYTTPAPLSSMPLFVRAGSILPFGPTLQHTGEKTDKPCELRIYPGADATFNLYNDAGDGYGYEKGERAIVPLRWDDAAATLTIGAREGRYPGMAETESFIVRFLQKDGSWKDLPVTYTGQQKVCKVL
jgi:alpha-D-xyloside xylohydrolase